MEFKRINPHRLPFFRMTIGNTGFIADMDVQRNFRPSQVFEARRSTFDRRRSWTLTATPLRHGAYEAAPAKHLTLRDPSVAPLPRE